MKAFLWLMILGMNLWAFCLMGIDKRRARQSRWRIRERTLWMVSACFGAVGGLIGMHLFRHKTRHRRFLWGMPLMAAAQAAVMVWSILRLS